MSAITEALLVELDDEALDRLAALLAPRLGRTEAVRGPSGWLNVVQAAEHLSCPKSRLYALVSAGRVPHHKDGSRTLFDVGELDAWVRAGGARRP